MPWAPRHQFPIFCLTLALAALAVFRWVTHPATAPAPGMAGWLSKNSALLLNPNTAPEHELSAIPGIGASRARAIVHARENGTVFHSLADLDSVRGFGESSLESAGPYLTFGP